MYWDTVCRADTNEAASPTVQQSTSLFNGTSLGLEYWTNMNIAGAFASDNTYIVLAIRVWLWFKGSSALCMYQLAAHQMYLQLTVGDKPQFNGQAWYFPSGGGIWGFDSTTPAMVNGLPSQEAILKLAKPVAIPARQHFTVTVNFWDTGSTSLRTQYLNSSTTIGMKEIKVLIDGIHTRDVL
ncbi:MAG: hypothetical protein ABIB11_06175 [Candidatus Omnitrophota bacterium]